MSMGLLGIGRSQQPRKGACAESKVFAKKPSLGIKVNSLMTVAIMRSAEW